MPDVARASCARTDADGRVIRRWNQKVEPDTRCPKTLWSADTDKHPDTGGSRYTTVLGVTGRDYIPPQSVERYDHKQSRADLSRTGFGVDPLVCKLGFFDGRRSKNER